MPQIYALEGVSGYAMCAVKQAIMNSIIKLFFFFFFKFKFRKNSGEIGAKTVVCQGE